MDKIERYLLATIHFYDLFNFPLTWWECCQWLYLDDQNQESLLDIDIPVIRDRLELLVANGQLIVVNGFYCLSGRESLALLRQRRYLYAELKFQIGIRAIKLLRILPFIKFIGICNTLAYSNASDDADIDLLVITTKNKLWTARFFATTLMKLLHWRPTKQNKKNKICLSFFISEHLLNINNLQFSPQDVYLQYWVKQVVPIYDQGGFYDLWWQSNQWASSYLPRVLPFDMNQVRRVNDRRCLLILKQVGESILVSAWVEKLFHKIQLKIMPPELLIMANQDTRIVLSDQALKFHDHDRRQKIAQQFQERLAGLTQRYD
ncbi:MAG: hypothetical protein COX77_04950 [Candidatus Komeilibacteria bacterium CG_4_10_14_0_2_um_filter_37_10]|uniref:Polymerase nucleotidyl transferase domain-containing protein n=1 Tax=Candidatus Komeilibacteria bacterium CG_4_10_14_0_2_um_filter_37_10 TaxID=1974470 RepID=A0A2M7VDI5_9BACT|nr:MAG: hypothetical protein COX77_04950 [Candidatus Komeilibacteria bacterium CG_4_10_14_0_2_um_filter_37_10]